MTHVYPVKPAVSARALIDASGYEKMYARSVNDNEAFWAEQAGRIDWIKPFSKVKDVSFAKDDLHIRWFEDGTLNVCYNCVDRHLPAKADDVAIIWEGDDPKRDLKITYRELHERVCKFANSLKSLGAKRGDRITIYMPMIPEAAVAMLACARIGAVHSVVFGGFSPDALAGRIHDCESNIVITADEGVRGGKKVPLKANVDAAAKHPDVTTLEKVLVVRNTGNEVALGRRSRCLAARARGDRSMPTAPAKRWAPKTRCLFLYTSGSTGKPKGVLHTTGGYLVYAAMTHEYVFDYHPGDVYWCTADVGWVTGHSYIVYGPLANGAITLMFEGVPNYPTCVALLGGVRQAPGEYLLHRADRDSCADARGRCAGQAHLTQEPAPAGFGGRTDQPGSLGVVLPRGRRRALPDCRYLVADRDRRHPDQPVAGRDGAEARLGDASRCSASSRRSSMARARRWNGAAAGVLILTDSWPGQMRTIYGDHQRFVETYFSTFEGAYFTGDGARRDEDGYYWITGRVDDVLNVSGPSHGHGRSRERAGRAQGRGRGGGGRLSARYQGAGHLRLRHADGR